MADATGHFAVERLPWDSEFFGFPIARISGVGPEGGGLDAAVDTCRSQDVACAYFLCGAGEPGTIVAAIRRGFRLVDVRVTLRAALEREVRPAPGARDAREDDLPALRSLARSLFRDSRFFTDGKFAVARVEDLFGRWIERDVETGIVAVVEREGGIAGFATARTGGSEAAIGLVGVAPESRGRGVGRQAVSALLGRLSGRAAAVRVVTQARNVGALGLYESLGFRTVSVEAWLHWWADENPV